MFRLIRFFRTATRRKAAAHAKRLSGGAVFALLSLLLFAAPAWAQADLDVEKTDSPDPVVEGEILTYTIVVRNTAPVPEDGGDANDAQNVELVDNLDPSVEFVSASDGCEATTDDVVTCELGTIAAGTSETVTIRVRPTAIGEIGNRAEANCTDTSPCMGDFDTTQTTVVPDLELTKTDDPDPVREDGLLAFTLTVENEGRADANDVVIRDELPDSVSFVRAFATDNGNCERNGDIVRCDDFDDAVTSDDPVSVTILVVPLEEGTITNEAAVFAEGQRRAIDRDTQDTRVESERDPNTPNDPNDPFDAGCFGPGGRGPG